MFFKDKTKECHQCAYVAGELDAGYFSGICPFCGEEMKKGPRIDNCMEFVREKEVYEQYLKGDAAKEKLYEERIARREKEFEERIKQHEEGQAERKACVPKCPTCGSKNVQKITNSSRFGSTLVWGIASDKIGKTMECKNCGYKW